MFVRIYLQNGTKGLDEIWLLIKFSFNFVQTGSRVKASYIYFTEYVLKSVIKIS